ncbi:type 2 periplasmic-binding domain-containing protein [Salinibius halmophilus]|uniref:hypothetical protein n=1 Tax=Salinibius halmophilus TaxID=1853216 RepID=UPI000E675E40|nr:hypothetical protein [Salinibius halmophilus]
MRIFLIAILLSANVAATTVTTIPPQSEFDASHGYFIALLELALSKTQPTHGDYQISFSNRFEQGRAIQDLKNNGTINVYWAGTSIEREQEINPIRIPLVKGMLGMRLFAIKEESRALFDRIESLDELKPLNACQGTHWPDSDILESAGIAVYRVAAYELMWGMLERKRCQYFPRGVHEIFAEIDVRKEEYNNLVIYPDTGVYYPFPMYFFTANDNPELAERIEQGLEMAIDDGSFEALMRNHEATKHLFPLSQWQRINWISIDNPTLPSTANPTDERYWFLPSSR